MHACRRWRCGVRALSGHRPSTAGLLRQQSPAKQRLTITILGPMGLRTCSTRHGPKGHPTSSSRVFFCVSCLLAWLSDGGSVMPFASHKKKITPSPVSRLTPYPGVLGRRSSIFLGFSPEIDPGSPLDRRGSPGHQFAPKISPGDQFFRFF